MGAALLTASTKAEAQATCDKAHAWRTANVPRYNAALWALPLQHPVDGTWAAPFADDMSAAFTVDELGPKVRNYTSDWAPPAAKKLS